MESLRSGRLLVTRCIVKSVESWCAGLGVAQAAAYAGRLSHRLPSSHDVAQPLDLRDKKSDMDYFFCHPAARKTLRVLGPL
jgi:hypothetical protein